MDSKSIIQKRRVIIEKKPELTGEEIVQNIISKRIDKISRESASRSLTPDETAFILNPKRELMEELGLSASSELYTELSKKNDINNQNN